LLKNISTFYTLVCGKHAPEGKSKPSRERTAINLEMKIRIICKYEGRESFSASALCFVVSTLNTILKGAAATKQPLKGMAVMKSMMMMIKKTEDAISEMGKLLPI
jgi:hypothetical protein